MSLYTRLLGIDTPRIPIHVFMAAVGEWERGRITQAQVVNAFNLSAGEETEAVTLLGKIVYPRETLTIVATPAGHTLTNVGASYDAVAVSQNMGFIPVQTAGITQIIFGVRVNKVGSGTQDWQLWNETDSQQVAVISDAGGTGVKTLQTTVDFGSPLGAGMKVVRVRARSSTAADDPVIFSAAASIRRASSLTPLELHEVLLLGEPDNSPYHSEAAIKSRLGIA